MIHPKVTLTLAAIVAFPTFVIFSNNAFFGPKNGSIISVDTKADGINQEQTNYSWSIDKYTETKNLQLAAGENYKPTFNIKVTREDASPTKVQGVEGQVCVKNHGKQKTEELQITSVIQYKNNKESFKNIAGAEQTISPEQLNSNSKACYPLKISFQNTDSTRHFRVRTEATVTNSAKRQRELAGDTDSFRLPRPITSTTNSATVTDTQTCPEDYNCVSSDIGPWNVTDSKTITYTTLIENTSASCNIPTSFTNEAKLTESSTQNTTSSKSTIPINTGSC